MDDKDYARLQQELESTWAHAHRLQEKLAEYNERSVSDRKEMEKMRTRIIHLERWLESQKNLANYWRERYEQQVSRTERAIKVANMTDQEREAGWEPFYYWCSKCGELRGFCKCDEPHLHKID